MTRIVRAAVRPALRVVGIDPSLTSTGVAFRKDGAVQTYTLKSNLTGPARLHFIRTEVEALIQYVQPQLVVYEDYVNGKVKDGRVFHIGELGGVLKTLFWERGIPVMLVSPTTLKMAITGKGNADAAKKNAAGKKVKDKTKPEMRAALQNTFGVVLDQGDEADACGLMLLGEMRHGSHTVSRAVQSKLKLSSISECVMITPSTR